MPAVVWMMYGVYDCEDIVVYRSCLLLCGRCMECMIVRTLLCIDHACCCVEWQVDDHFHPRRENFNWVLESWELHLKMLTGFSIPGSFIKREKIWTRLSIPRSSIERSLGCIMSETARKPNYRFSVRPRPKSWLSVEKGSWYDDHDKTYSLLFENTGHDLHRWAAVAVLLPCYPCHCHWQWVLFPDLILYLYLCPMSLSIPLFWINLSFVLIFSTINPPLMTYCIPDTKQRRHYQHRHHKCHRYTSVIVIITIVMMRRRCIEIGQPRAYLALAGASASRLFTNCDSFCTLVN